MKRFIKYFFYALLGLPLLCVIALVSAYFYVSVSLPKVETLADYRPPLITQIYADDGATIAEYSEERRILMPFDKMPRQLVQAFVAAEDSSFFKHQGLDFQSILRAAFKNIQAGGISQGGSTITQQVAKQLLLTPERSFSRKFKEAILAWRMEQTLSKEEIIYLYLNQIYLGHRAFGVEAAAQNYFDKGVDQLTLAECAILAGLPQAPSRYSPYRHYQRAMERQKYVLKRMVEEGFISPAEAKLAAEEVVAIKPRLNNLLEITAYFNEQVRRYLEERFGSELLYTGGLQVETSINIAMQQVAQQAVKENLRDHDKRQGYRGPLQVVSEAEFPLFLSLLDEQRADQPLVVGSIAQALVVGVANEQILCKIGQQDGVIPLQTAKWAAPLSVTAAKTLPSGNGTDAKQTRLPIGSVIEVQIVDTRQKPWQLSLQQTPLAQGALIAIDPFSGEIKAMVGGYDFAQSQFNRAIQAKRLPGSAIKPLIYAAALDKGYTPASVILDTPLIYENTAVQTGKLEEWKPQNYEEKFYGPTSFRQALAHSRNVVTIKILEDIGLNYTANYASKLGIETPLARDLTMALGSTAVTPLELLTAYAVFANGGVLVPPTYINRIRDRDGRILESVDPADFAGGMAEDQRLIRKPPRRVISPETAYLITNIMESVVQDGTGGRARALDRPTAAKTGTTNDLKDAWFVGYIPQLATVSWVGYDQERSLGKGETGAKAAAPAWVDFMQEAIKQYPLREFQVPDSIEFYPIDPENGLLLADDSDKAQYEAFAPGTAPTRRSEEEQLKPRDFFRLDMEEML